MTDLLEHERSWTTSAVTVAKEEQALIGDFEVLVV